MKATKIMNVNLVVNHFLNPKIWRNMHTIHNGHKDHKCYSCGKSFSDAGYLKQHIHSVHEGYKDHKCESCGKSFSETGYLKKHIHTVHEGHKNHKCNSCSKSFSEAGSLRKHIHIVHEGNKDHKCESCGKTFSFKSHLKVHIHAVHEGRKDHKCVYHFLEPTVWRSTFKQFMKATKIKNVTIVVNHFLKQEVWRDISTEFMKATNQCNDKKFRYYCNIPLELQISHDTILIHLKPLPLMIWHSMLIFFKIFLEFFRLIFIPKFFGFLTLSLFLCQSICFSFLLFFMFFNVRF